MAKKNAVGRYMRIVFRIWCILLLCAAAAYCEEEKPANRYVAASTNYFAKVGQTIQVDVYLVPPSQTTEEITMDPTWGARFSQSKLLLEPGQHKKISAIIGKSDSGLVWIHGSPSGSGYADAWTAVVVDFEGRLKLSSTPTLSYKTATTLSVTMQDKAGKPLALPASMQLRLTSGDGLLQYGNSAWKDTLLLPLPLGSQTSPLFKLSPTLVQGGSVHLAGSLLMEDQDVVLAQDEFPLNSDPALWLPVLLAVMGGVLHGLYKSLRLLDDSSTTKLVPKVLGILLSSALAGLIGYFFAHLDLLGLKLDPNLLRSYPLIGFLFSYFGFEVLIPKSWATKGGAAAESVKVDANLKT